MKNMLTTDNLTSVLGTYSKQQEATLRGMIEKGETVIFRGHKTNTSLYIEWKGSVWVLIKSGDLR